MWPCTRETSNDSKILLDQNMTQLDSLIFSQKPFAVTIAGFKPARDLTSLNAPKNRQQGFTLIEIIMVIVILSILSLGSDG